MTSDKTLRDEFAMAAPIDELVTIHGLTPGFRPACECTHRQWAMQLAHARYVWANAMMAARWMAETVDKQQKATNETVG